MPGRYCVNSSRGRRNSCCSPGSPSILSPPAPNCSASAACSVRTSGSRISPERKPLQRPNTSRRCRCCARRDRRRATPPAAGRHWRSRRRRPSNCPARRPQHEQGDAARRKQQRHERRVEAEVRLAAGGGIRHPASSLARRCEDVLAQRRVVDPHGLRDSSAAATSRSSREAC